MKFFKMIFLNVIFFALFQTGFGQFVPVGSGGYTTAFPGVDIAGRNTFPAGTPFLSGEAAEKPVPTNDWYSAVIKNGQASNLFNYPFTMKTTPQGMVVTYIPFGPIDDIQPVIVGVSELSAGNVTVSDHSDWVATFDWNDGTRNFTTTSGVGMPFLYFTKSPGHTAQITINSGNVTVAGEMLLIVDARNGADFAVYAPEGSVWNQSGNVYTSDLNGKNYWSLAFIPLTAPNVAAVAEEYKQHAYVFPVNTVATYSFDENTSVMRTDFEVETDVKEGSNTNMLLGLLPHQWANLSSDSPSPEGYSYATIRGEMKTLAGNSFSVENTFHGVLPTLPYVDFYSEGFSPFDLAQKIESIENTVMADWTDSYNEGQVFNMLLQTARIADLSGNLDSRDKIIATLKNRMEDWLLAESQEVAFLFYYNDTWSAMIGYPAGHGQDGGLNDHHFHWGYFIQACTFIEQYNPGWADEWGGMVNLLVRDAASSDRNDDMFPFLRNFSPYAGHSWADGFATFPQGNNQESSSESMVFASSLINWGAVTGNDEIRDLGIYLYTTEYTGIEEYYMDMNERNFPPTQQYALISRLWGNSFDNQTFWTGDIAASYGIEIYPIQGGSLYLGINNDYAELLWDEVAANTGILFNEENPNLWHDEWWKFLAFTDAAQAIEMYNSFPGRQLKFGVSDAQTYHWVHAMNALGKVNSSITADYPIAAVFEKDGVNNYVANNYSGNPITVTFSDGYALDVPARKMATSIDGAITGVVSTPYGEAYQGGAILLELVTSGGNPTKVEYMNGGEMIGSLTAPPYDFTVSNLQPGIHSFYVKIYDGERLTISNTVKVIVGEQYPLGTAAPIPGTIETGNYDFFIGGKGQNISYYDATDYNEGDYRTNESVDAFQTPNEGATIGYIASGEWLEFTVDVAEAGYYSMSFRYASGNQSGGGPFHLEADGEIITDNITVPTTNGWDNWATKSVSNIPLTPGSHILRLVFNGGEFNMGKMIFSRSGDLDFTYPIANAGDDFKVLLPQTAGMLDGSASSESGGNALSYNWQQIYGPSVASISDPMVVNPSISGLTEGIYKFELTATNPALRSDKDEVLVMVTPFDNAPPQVALLSPADNSTFTEGTPVSLSALASDFDGSIEKVEFFKNDTLITTVTAPPFVAEWNPEEGIYSVTAKATDNQGAVSVSQPSQVTVEPLMLCSGTSTEALQGSFTDGYNWWFQTVGSNVVITFELLDEKQGVVAYLWKENPFGELPMTHVEGRKFTATITGQTIGTVISYACKFAFAGGMSVTSYIEYEVGSSCNTTGIINNNFTPVSFYPNPAKSEIFINGITETSEVSIFDLTGKLLIQQNDFQEGGKIDVSKLEKGVYLIRIKNKHSIQTARMVRQ
jgi:endoglucanase Acf2